MNGYNMSENLHLLNTFTELTYFEVSHCNFLVHYTTMGCKYNSWHYIVIVELFETYPELYVLTCWTLLNIFM